LNLLLKQTQLCNRISISMLNFKTTFFYFEIMCMHTVSIYFLLSHMHACACVSSLPLTYMRVEIYQKRKYEHVKFISFLRMGRSAVIRSTKITACHTLARFLKTLFLFTAQALHHRTLLSHAVSSPRSCRSIRACHV
jgi:hypothetical protein